MLWRFWSSALTGAGFKTEESIDQSKYQSILAQNTQASVLQLKMKEDFSFQLNQNAKLKSKWLQKSISVLEQPRQGPDLNYIKNLWNDFTRAVHRRSTCNLIHLDHFLKGERNNAAFEAACNSSPTSGKLHPKCLLNSRWSSPLPVPAPINRVMLNQHGCSHCEQSNIPLLCF